MRLTDAAMNGQNGNKPSMPDIKVLVVDDDWETTDLLKVILEPGGFEVTVTNSGQDGIEQARRTHPDIIILDLLMPGVDGLEVCKAMRKFSNVPILILSALDTPGLMLQALDEGADDYLSKPIKSAVLIASLNKLVRRARAEKKATHANNVSRMA